MGPERPHLPRILPGPYPHSCGKEKQEQSQGPPCASHDMLHKCLALIYAQ